MLQSQSVVGLNGKATVALQQKDARFRKIFVGGLPYHTSDESLRDYFAVFGDIEEAVVITDRQTGKSKGYGFVTMVDAASAERACKDPNPIIDGRKANVNLAYIGAKPRNNATPALHPVPAGSFLPVPPHIAPTYPILYQPPTGHYLPQNPLVAPSTGYPAALVTEAYPNVYGNPPFQASSAYILPTIPTQPGIQVRTLSSLSNSGLAFSAVAPAGSETQNPGLIAASTQPTYAQLVAHLPPEGTDRH